VDTCECIFCCSPCGSAEHIVQACLGGLRTDRGILCGTCNVGFSSLDAALGTDVRALNALLGVDHGRTGEPIETVVTHDDTGRTFVLRGRRLQHPEVLLLQDETADGVQRLHALASTQKQADDFVHELKQKAAADGKPVTISKRERVPHLFASPASVAWGFGGEPTFRAIAKVALNILAHMEPAIARERWLTPIKHFVLHGGAPEPWVCFDYEAIEDRLPEPTFLFQHRFVIVFDALGSVDAHVSLFGVVELTVHLGKRLGAREPTIPMTLIYDVDLLAAREPDDVRTYRLDRVAWRPGHSQAPEAHVAKRLPLLLSKRDAMLWDQDAPQLLLCLNAVRGAPLSERHDLIVDALDGQQQRLLNLAAYVAAALRKHLVATFGDEAAQLADGFALFAQSDRSSRTGVTDVTATTCNMLRFVLADHLLTVLDEREIGSAELRSLLEGKVGAGVVGAHIFEVLKKTDPRMRNA
jgi:hypothetical protein